ncbi:flagellar basal body-associated FliL family protein [Paenibacillus sp. Leaf72]|uniref:flagellar basal body-associated FliL family protein n=1 Tax=Paenibacillus sp. Leaf72 TaxID=1736234 RepID=UPI0006F9A018|nr:flagellar basal body-associated FliL family protein [Paenibacillus sp. Leaf72]KQO04413.1 flagellar basal body protein FliL [Paenibacillus sp. Leaf72]
MKKMLPWLVTILLSIVLIAVVVVIMWPKIMGSTTDGSTNKEVEVKHLTADERVEVTSELKEFKRNLKDSNKVVVVSFAFQLDSKKTKEDFDKIIEIEVKPIINRALADMTAEELNGSKGEDLLESKLLNEINPILDKKQKLVKVEITAFIMTNI